MPRPADRSPPPGGWAAALVKGAELRGTKDALAANTERARADGVRTLPAVWVDGRVLEGERAIPA